MPIFCPGVLSSACPVSVLLWKHLGHAEAKAWRGWGNLPLQDATELLGDKSIPERQELRQMGQGGFKPPWDPPLDNVSLRHRGLPNTLRELGTEVQAGNCPCTS